MGDLSEKKGLHVHDAVHRTAVERAQAAAVAVERERHRELTLRRDRVADLVDVRRRLRVDGEQ